MSTEIELDEVIETIDEVTVEALEEDKTGVSRDMAMRALAHRIKNQLKKNAGRIEDTRISE